MSKKFIRNAALISLGALIVGGILLAVMGSAATWPVILFMAVAFIAFIISYIGALVKVAGMRRMGWFVGILLTGIIGVLLYSLIGPEIQVSNEAMSSFLYRAAKETKKTVGY
jgi:hypothetical protein